MARMPHLALILMTTALPAAAQDWPATQFVNSRHVRLTYDSPFPSEVDRVQLWVSTDDASNWSVATATQPSPQSVLFEAPADGKYCLFVILENANGTSASAPGPETVPHAVIVVDSSPPTMQLHKAHWIAESDSSPVLRLNVSLIEENLADGGSRVFYREADEGRWHDGGPVRFDAGIMDWTPSAVLPREFELRVVTTDRAGNRAVDDLPGFVSNNLARSARPTTPETRASDDLVHAADVELVTVPPVAPVAPVTLDDDHEPQPIDDRTTRLVESRKLLDAARHYLAIGKPYMAESRLDDALKLAPNDPDLLVDLGNTLYRARRFGEAGRVFLSARQQSPQHLGAIEGMALVAVTENRYPEARDSLQQILKLDPESAQAWLRYGDVEHKLGEFNQAIEAWDKVLQIESADDATRKKAHERIQLFAPGRRVSANR